MRPYGVTAGCLVAAAGLGVLSADGWRLDNTVVTAVSSVQSTWVLLPWLAALWTRGSVRRGVLLGAACGLVSIGSYYVYEALAYDPHAATSQFGSTGGFWVPASTLAGALYGLFGTLAARSGRRTRSSRPGRLAPFAWATMLAPPTGEAIYLLRTPGAILASSTVAVWFLLLVAAIVAALGLRRYGARRFAPTVPVVMVAGLACFAGVLWLEHTLAYVTL